MTYVRTLTSMNCPQPAHRRRATELHVAHLERDQADPCRVVEGVDAHARWEQLLDGCRFVRPVEVGQFAPALTEDRTPIPRWGIR